MLLDNLSLAFLVRELNPLLENAFVNKVSQLEKGVLKIKLHTKQGSKDLILAPNAFYISSYSMPATHKKSNFTASLRKELYNKRITAIEQHDFDRVVALKFLEHSLVLELLGEGNAALLDSKGKIISCLKNESWSDREIRKGSQYKFPHARGLNPLEISAEKLSGIFSSSEKDAVRTLISALNISPLAAEEILFALKIDKGLKASALTEKDFARIAEKVKDFYSAEKSSASGAFAYKDFVYPFKLKHLTEQPVPAESINSFLDEALSEKVSKTKAKDLEESNAEEKISRLEFHKKQQGEARKKFEAQAEENKKKAELIYENFSALEGLRKAVLSGAGKGLSEKEIMYKIGSAASKGNKTAKLLKSVDLKKKVFEAEL